MSLSHLSLKQLEQAVQLLKQKEIIQSRLEEIDDQLRRLQIEKTPLLALGKEDRPSDEHRGEKRRRRKNIQQAVIKVLKKADAAGLSVKEVAFRAKIKTASLRTWLYTKGKTAEAIVQKGRGIFAYKSS